MNIEKSKKWEDLTISNDYIFAKVMQDKEICKEVLSMLLEIEIGDIEYIEEQKSINVDYQAKSVRLDVYTEDNKNVYNVEMQTTDTKELSKRSRYYQSIVDLNSIEKGEYYKKLKDSYVVFICTFDLFQQNLPKYEFENYCKQDKELKLNDGTYKIFFNTQAFEKEKNEKLKLFLKYVNGEKEENEFIKKLDEKVVKIKENKEFRGEYMKLLVLEQDMFEQGKQEGLQQGVEQGIKQGMIVKQIEMLKRFKMTKEYIMEEISRDYNLTDEEIQKYL